MPTAELSPVLIALISAGSAILGAGVVALANIFTTRLTERGQKQRRLTELAFQAAIEQYKSDKALMLELGARQPAESFRQYPLDDYIIGMYKLAHLLGREPSDEELGRALDDRQQTINVARSRYKSMSEASREEAERRVRRGAPPAPPRA